MKKNIQYLLLGVLALMSSCQDPEYVLPTAERQGITSLTALFTSGPYVDKEAVVYTIADASVDKYVIPIPWFYPEDSENETAEYMKTMRVQAKLAPNCTINPVLTILDLTKENYFTYTDAQGYKKQICITGERVKSNKCQLLSFSIPAEDISGIIDEEHKTVSLISAEDLSSCLAEYSLSSHATMSPDPKTEALDFNSPVELTVIAHDGVTKQTYTVQKAVPDKIPYGYRKGSETELFKLDMGVIGLPWTSANSPSLAVNGNNLVVCLGDGSTAPTYYNASTGSKIGNMTLGSVGVASLGCVTSDSKGNILLATKAANGKSFSIYKTSSVTTVPTLLISYTNNTSLDMGTKVSVQGDINTNAAIIATCDGTASSGSNTFVRWIITDGVLGSPEVVSVNGVGYWGSPVSNTKVVTKGTTAQSDYFLSYYDPNVLYWVNGTSNNASKSLSNSDNGNSWAMNNNCLDARTFNNAQYLVLVSTAHFPQWGGTPYLYMYDVTSDGSFTGTVSTSYALTFNPSLSSFGSADGVAATGDVLFAPTTDGYKLRLYYVDNNCKIIGGYEFDCIDK